MTDYTMFEQMTPQEAQAYAEGAAAAEPVTLPPTLACMKPDELGQLDAREGRPCVPEMYYAARHKMTLYVLGWQDEAGETETTRAFLEPEPDVDETPDVHPRPWA